VFIGEALNPASIEKVGIDEQKKSALVVVADSQLSLAIGKNGQNVRLAAKLTGWKIDIISSTEYEKEKLEREQEIKAALAAETENMAVEEAGEEKVGEEEVGQSDAGASEESKLEPAEESAPEESQPS
jgi:N utilization substance protein A